MTAQEGTEPRFASYGKPWGEAAARCLCVADDVFGHEESLRILPIPGSFLCPISQEVMVDPVATVDGSVYERAYIEQWFRQKQQRSEPATSPATGVELQSKLLLPLVALQKAIETYLEHRPELQTFCTTRKSYEEAAKLLQQDLKEKSRAQAKWKKEQQARWQKEQEAITKNVVKLQDENARLKKALRGLLNRQRDTRDKCAQLAEEVKQTAFKHKQAVHLQKITRQGSILQEKRRAIEYGCLALISSLSTQHREIAVEEVSDEDSPRRFKCSPVRVKSETSPCSPRSIEVIEVESD